MFSYLPYIFFVFLVSVLFIYYSIPDKYRVYVLCLSSIIFIAGFSIVVAIFSLTFTLLNYFLGIFLEKISKKEHSVKNRFFWFCILVDVAILAFFKYFNSHFEEINSLFFSSGFYSDFSYLSIMIPIGISYYTFQCLGYLIRIDRGSEKAERNFAVFSTYLLFFPKFLAGPVERSNHFFPQLFKPSNFDRNNIVNGSRLFLWGLFKKVVIADILYLPVSKVYSSLHAFSGISLLIVLIVQTIYIYCDFSGYTDMALGISKMFGINLIDNFNRPFLAKNISDFWRRWHISLSSWCNDFIYNPFIVKFRRFGNTAVILGIFLTFFIVGIWHGDKLTFVILGILQGIAIVYEFYTKRKRLKIASNFKKATVNTFSRILVFLYMAFSMVFFFSNSIGDAWYFLSHLFSKIQVNSKAMDFITEKPQFLFALLCFIILFIVEIYNEKGKILLNVFLNLPQWIKGISYLAMMLLIWAFSSHFYPFYYMRF